MRRVKQQVESQEAIMGQQIVKARAEMEATLRREREEAKMERKSAVRDELQRLRDETQRAVERLSEQLVRERHTIDAQQNTIKVPDIPCLVTMNICGVEH